MRNKASTAILTPDSESTIKTELEYKFSAKYIAINTNIDFL